MSAYAKLRRKRQLFVDAYVATGVITAAAVASGYGGRRPEVAGSKMFANPEVKAAIAERTEEAIAKAGARVVRVIEEACLIAYAGAHLTRGPDGRRLAFKDMSQEALRAAHSIEFEPDGTVKHIRFSKTDGLNLLAKYLKMLTDVHEHQGKDGGPIKTEEVSDLEKARRIAFLLNQGVRAAGRAPSPLSDEPVSDDESDV
jgi:phage terminase small subunit